MDVQEQVVAWLAQQEVDTYLVGGSVRDWLLGRPVYDLDVATPGDGVVLARSLANHFRGDYYPLDAARSTGRAILPSQGERRLVVDVARYRGADLAADLADRDFTVNALAVSARAPEEIIDHHGGLADLEAGLIRAVSPDSIRRDPVRALRAVRLVAQLDFALAPDTETLIRQDGAALAGVSSERLRDEVAHLLALSRAAPYLVQLDELGLLTTILPELEPLRDFTLPPPHHLDALRHSLATVQTLELLLLGVQKTWMQGRGLSDPQLLSFPIPDSLCRLAGRMLAHVSQVMSDARPRLVTLKLAALLHDTGKPLAQAPNGRGQVHFFGHEIGGAGITAEALKRLRFSNTEVRVGATVVRHHMRPVMLANQPTVSSRAVYRFYRDTGETGVDVLLHALADYWATYAPDAAGDRWLHLVALVTRMLGDYWERQAERVDPPPLIDGCDLLREFGLQPGPRIGELLEAVREAQVSGQVLTREDALALVQGSLLTGVTK